jgi:hypothetical protein
VQKVHGPNHNYRFQIMENGHGRAGGHMVDTHTSSWWNTKKRDLISDMKITLKQILHNGTVKFIWFRKWPRNALLWKRNETRVSRQASHALSYVTVLYSHEQQTSYPGFDSREGRCVSSLNLKGPCQHALYVKPNTSPNQWFATRGPPCGIMRPAEDFLKRTILNKIRVDTTSYWRKKQCQVSH